MLRQDASLIRELTLDTNDYLDRLQRLRLRWAEVDAHTTAAHIAEALGDKALAMRHLHTVPRLLMALYAECPEFAGCTHPTLRSAKQHTRWQCKTA